MENDSDDDAQTRGLFNALRTGDRGVSFEALMREIYFLQHRAFSLFDAKDAFHASIGKWAQLCYGSPVHIPTDQPTDCTARIYAHAHTGMNGRWLTYRDFTRAIAKLAKARYSTVPVSTSSDADDTALAAALLADVAAIQQSRSRMDALRLQMVKFSVLEVLEMHLPQLAQSFQLYGTSSAVRDAQDVTATTISLDGFLDFLNAYVEYEDYLSYQQIDEMVREMTQAFSTSRELALVEPTAMHFGHFVELVCRVATAFHHRVLVREGAQLRRAVESSRLEFSIELLLQHMNIKIMRDESLVPSQLRAGANAEPGALSIDPSLEDLTLDVEHLSASDNDKTATFESVVNDIRRHLDAYEQTASRPRRAQSVLFARLPPRRATPNAVGPSNAAVLGGSVGVADSIPIVSLIIELVAPPPLPPNVLAKFEHAVTLQNTGQFHMALGMLEACKAKYSAWRDASLQHVAMDDDDDDVDVRVFFHLAAASIFDSAKRNFAALLHHVEALKLADRFEASTPNGSTPLSALVKSCLGCVLFYAGEVALAKTCQQHVLDARRRVLGPDHLDTATAMNNLACCLSQDPTGAAIDEAFLLLKRAARVYHAAFGASHPRTALVQRNLERVTRCQRVVVVDPNGALARGEYAHVIPGSRFQIRALEPLAVKPKGKSKLKSKTKKKSKKKSK